MKYSMLVTDEDQDDQIHINVIARELTSETQNAYLLPIRTREGGRYSIDKELYSRRWRHKIGFDKI